MSIYVKVTTTGVYSEPQHYFSSPTLLLQCYHLKCYLHCASSSLHHMKTIEKKIILYVSFIRGCCLVLFSRNSRDLSVLVCIFLNKQTNTLCILPKNHSAMLSQFHTSKHVGMSQKYYRTKSLGGVGPPCDILALLLISAFLEELSPRPHRASLSICNCSQFKHAVWC